MRLYSEQFFIVPVQTNNKFESTRTPKNKTLSNRQIVYNYLDRQLGPLNQSAEHDLLLFHLVKEKNG